MRRLIFFAAGIVAVLVAAWLFRSFQFRSTQPASRDGRPNIILIYADDIDGQAIFGEWPRPAAELIGQLRFPGLRAMAADGLILTNFHATTPLCGPSRACLLTGQYAHRNQFRVNRPAAFDACGFTGGFRVFDANQNLGVWMKNAGYKTAFLGKYLHSGFNPNASRNETWSSIKPTGWDQCRVTLGGRYFDFMRVDFENPQTTKVTNRYRTDLERDDVLEIIEHHVRDGSHQKPLFLCWAPLAAHQPDGEREMFAERHRNDFVHSQPPGLDQHLRQSTQNPILEMQGLHSLSSQQIKDTVEMWRDRSRSIAALDEAIQEIRDLLQQLGQLENTVIIFTADHGFQMGRHRHVGKRLPYEQITRVPCIVSGRGVARGQTCDQLLANIDLAPTILGMAGRHPPETVDGQSFVDLLENTSAELNPPRDKILIENWEVETSLGHRIQATYSALRYHDAIYTEWSTGGREYYDLATDPQQIRNLYPELEPAEKNRLWSQLRAIRKAETDPLIANVVRLDCPEQQIISANRGDIEISGFAEDDFGIAEIKLEIRDIKNDLFWTGKSWSPERHWINADIESPKAQVTRWSYHFNAQSNPIASQQDFPDKPVTVSILATDLQGNSSHRSNAKSFTLKLDEPETWIDTPASSDPHVTKRIPVRRPSQPPLVVTGRAADDQAVKQVALVFRDLKTGKYWNGSNWVEGVFRHYPDLTVEPNDSRKVRWQFTYTGKSQGELYVSARAIDHKRIFDRTISARTLPPP